MCTLTEMSPGSSNNKISPAELDAIRQLRDRLAPRNILEDWKLNNDRFLLRYLKANRFSLDKADAMIQTYVEFLEHYKVNELVHQTFPEEFSNIFTTYFGGFDHEGRPISMVPQGGLWNLKEVIQNGKEEMFINYVFKVAAIFEKIILESDSDYGIMVCDIGNLAYGNYFHKRTLEILLFLCRMIEKVAPGLIGKVCVVNASKLFVALVNTVKKLVTLTAEICIMDSNEEKWKASLKKIFPEEGISPHFGGVLKKFVKV